MTLPVNKPKDPSNLKGDAIAIKRLLLDKDGKELNDDAKIFIKHLMCVSGMMYNSDMIPSDRQDNYIGRRDVVLTILDAAFDDLSYYDQLIKLSTEENGDYNGVYPD